MELYNQNKGALDLGHSNDLQELANGKLDSDTQRYNQYISSLMSLEDAYNANMLSANTQSSNNVTDLLNSYRDREYAAQDQTANNALFVLESMRENPNYTDENGNLTKDGYKRMSDYFASISSALDEPTKKMLKNYLQGWAPDTTSSSSGIKDSSGKRITDYYSWNTLSDGSEIRALGNLRTTGDRRRWEDKKGEPIRLTYYNADGSSNNYVFKLGDKLQQKDYDNAWKYLEDSRGRTPQEGDSVMYNGRLVVVCENNSLRTLQSVNLTHYSKIRRKRYGNKLYVSV